MAIPPDVRAEAESALTEFSNAHSSVAGADRLRYIYQFETNAVILLEQRPSFMNAAEWSSKRIAKFRYSEARNNWSLYWSDSDGRWHRVTDVEAAQNIRVLLQVVVSDPLGVFWS